MVPDSSADDDVPKAWESMDSVKLRRTKILDG